jgi:hypothetical protein
MEQAKWYFLGISQLAKLQSLIALMEDKCTKIIKYFIKD